MDTYGRETHLIIKKIRHYSGEYTMDTIKTFGAIFGGVALLAVTVVGTMIF
jgi:hypothetical protein